MADSVSVWNSQPHLWQWWLSSVIDEEAVALLTLSASSSGRLCNGTVSVRLSAYRSVCLSRRSTAAATCSSFAAAGAGGTYQSTYASAAYRLSIDILSAARVRGSKRAGSVLLWSKRRGDKKGKGSLYSIPELIPVLGSQPAGDVNHKPGGRLPLLSTRPAITLATNFAAWWTEALWV